MNQNKYFHSKYDTDAKYLLSNNNYEHNLLLVEIWLTGCFRCIKDNLRLSA